MAEFELDPIDLSRLIHAVPDPLSVLDSIEVLNTLPEATITIEGTWDCGETPTR